jgi:hypothetical protein
VSDTVGRQDDQLAHVSLAVSQASRLGSILLGRLWSDLHEFGTRLPLTENGV